MVNLSNSAPFRAVQDGTVVQFRLTDTNRLKLNDLTSVSPFVWLGTAQERIDTAKPDLVLVIHLNHGRNDIYSHQTTPPEVLVSRLLVHVVAMEKMPYQDQLRPQAGSIPFDWHFGLPTIEGEDVTLREVRESDAPALLAMLTSDEVAEFVSPLPRTVDGFVGFITEAHHERTRGNCFCFGVVPKGYDDAMGLFQVRQLEPGFGSAEWGFAIGSPFWGSGVFLEGARAVIDFSFGVVGVHRLEARSISSNARGNAALRKVGALQEGILRRSFQRNGRYFDQILWSILKDDWRQAKAVWGPKLH